MNKIVVDCSGWFFCSHCKSDDYIIDYFPKEHWAYRDYKTQDRNEYYKVHLKTKEHLDHFKDFKCIPCNMQFWNKKEYEEHTHTLHHKRRAKVDHKCDACNVKFEFISQLEAHNKTKKHQDNANGTGKPDKYVCETCNYETSFKHHYEQHCDGKKHMDKVNGIEKQDSFHCDECNYTTAIKGLFQQHCKSKKHIENKNKKVVE